MRAWVQSHASFAVALVLASAGPGSAQVVDRMLAIVEGQVVTEGDLARYRALAASFDEDDLPASDRALLDRVIGDMLVRTYVARVPGLAATEQDIDRFLAAFSLREDPGFPLSAEDLRQGARERIESLRYFRIRFEKPVSEDEVQLYFDTVFAPEAAERGLELTLDEAAGVVEELVRLETILREAETWAAGLPERSRVEIVE